MLHHAGGWNRDAGPDLESYQTLQPLASFLTDVKHTPSGPPDCTTLMSYVESQPLQVIAAGQGNTLLQCRILRSVGGDPGNQRRRLPRLHDRECVCPSRDARHDVGGHAAIRTTGSRICVLRHQHAGRHPRCSRTFVISSLQCGARALQRHWIARSARGCWAGSYRLRSIWRVFAGAIASGKLPNLFGPSLALPTFCTGPFTLPFCGWPQDYYSDSSTLPSYECVTVSEIPPYAPY